MACDDEFATPVSPDPGLLEYLHIRGLNCMEAPFRAVDGTETEPSIAFKSQPGDGFWSQDAEELALSLGRRLAFLFTKTGFALVIDNIKGTFTHANTADRTYTFQDKDCTVACLSDLPAQTTYTNNDSVTIEIGMPVKISGSAGIVRAQGDAIGNQAIGVATQSIATTATGTVLVSEAEVTRGDWTAVLGSASLSVGTEYFLDASTAGMITATAPTTPGEIWQPIGVAKTTTILVVQIEEAIVL